MMAIVKKCMLFLARHIWYELSVVQCWNEGKETAEIGRVFLEVL